MNGAPADLARLPLRVLAVTPAGRDELREPRLGLSLPQRWLLGQLDGQSDLAVLSLRRGSPSPERLPRDGDRLVQLGLTEEVGTAEPDAGSSDLPAVQGEPTPAPAGAVPPMSARAAFAPRPAAPRLVAGAVVLALAAAVVYAAMGGRAGAGPVAAASAAAVASAHGEPAPLTSSEAARVAAVWAEVLAVRPAAHARAPQVPAPAKRTQVHTPAARPPAAASAARPTPDPAPASTAAAPGPTAASAAPLPAAAPAPASLAALAPPASAPVMAAAPAPAASTPAAESERSLRPISTVEPAFPADGLGLGGRSVVLQASLVVDASGAVTAVGFAPSGAATRAFERAARTALLQWRFPAGRGERHYTQRVRFSEE